MAHVLGLSEWHHKDMVVRMIDELENLQNPISWTWSLITQFLDWDPDFNFHKTIAYMAKPTVCMASNDTEKHWKYDVRICINIKASTSVNTLNFWPNDHSLIFRFVPLHRSRVNSPNHVSQCPSEGRVCRGTKHTTKIGLKATKQW